LYEKEVVAHISRPFFLFLIILLLKRVIDDWNLAKKIVHDVVVTLNFSRVRQLFLFLFFLSRRKSRRVETCFAPYPFTWHRWRFSARPFLLCFMYPYPLIVRPIEFLPFLASLALVALEAGQSRRSCFSWFFFFVAASCRIFVLCVILFASRIWSHRL
jgi:hypothetical protein